MPPVTTCPTDELLSAYGLGKASDAEIDSVTAHIEHCSTCRERAASVPGDSFVERLRAGRLETPVAGESSDGPVHATLPTVPASDLPRELADHPDYEKVRELGRGGMGVVYLARHKLMNRWEVLKEIGRAHV